MLHNLIIVLMGAAMTIGVATANSILIVVFANEQRPEGKHRREAALNAGAQTTVACADDRVVYGHCTVARDLRRGWPDSLRRS